MGRVRGARHLAPNQESIGSVRSGAPGLPGAPKLSLKGTPPRIYLQPPPGPRKTQPRNGLPSLTPSRAPPLRRRDLRRQPPTPRARQRPQPATVSSLALPCRHATNQVVPILRAPQPTRRRDRPASPVVSHPRAWRCAIASLPPLGRARHRPTSPAQRVSRQAGLRNPDDYAVAFAGPRPHPPQPSPPQRRRYAFSWVPEYFGLTS